VKRTGFNQQSRRPKTNKIWRGLRWAFLFLLIGFVAYQSYIFAHVIWFRWNNPETTAFMDAERDRLIAKRLPANLAHKWVPYSAISTNAKQAVIAAEDSGFALHDGVDWESIEKAAKDNLRRGKIKRGGSTITMQLAKNLFLSSDRSYLRKAQELLITGMLEITLDKKRILELYLNTAEWGVGVFGIEAAARHYFGISALQLDPMQAAWLASVLPSPKRFDRNRESDYLTEQAFVILDRMPKVALPR
jgi:monofunctional glycosyltransferase